MKFQKDHKVPIEWREAIRKAQKGKKETMITRQKNSMIHKKIWENPTQKMLNHLKELQQGHKGKSSWNKGTKGVMKCWWKGKKFSESHKRNIGLGNLGRKHSRETKLIMSLQKIGDKNPMKRPELRQKVSEKLLGKHCSPRTEFTSETAKKYGFQKGHPQYQKTMKMTSKPQFIMYKKIKEMYPDAMLNMLVKTRIKNRFADVGIPSLGICIEYDCDYWHQDKERDAIRKREIEEQGWKVFSISDLEELENVITTIQNIEHNQTNGF